MQELVLMTDLHMHMEIFQHIEIEQSVWDGSNTSSSRSIDGIPILLSDGDSSPVPGKKYSTIFLKDSVKKK